MRKVDIETVAAWCGDWEETTLVKVPGWKIEREGDNYKVTLRFQRKGDAAQHQVERWLNLTKLKESEFPSMELEFTLGGAAKILEENYYHLLQAEAA